MQQATELARQMVTRWGMSRRSGWSRSTRRRRDDFLGSVRAAALVQRGDRAAGRRGDGRIVDECYRQALEILARERARLDALAEALLQRESLDEREILEVVGLPDRRVAGAAA